MSIGISARLGRIRTDNRFLIVPMDHGLTMGAVQGLADIESTIAAVTSGGADAVLTQKGIAPRVHGNLHEAGYIVHLNGSTKLGPDVTDKRPTGTVQEALRVGADAVSFHLNTGSDHEREQLEDLASVTDTATQFGVPVLAMTYVRGHDVSATPETIAHAVRIGEELGADVIKSPYTGDPESFESVIDATGLPVVIAGGAKGTDAETVEMVEGAMEAGAAGVSMGRSIFQHEDPEAITSAVSGIIHDELDASTALARAGLD